MREDGSEEAPQAKLSGAQVLSQRASRKADDQEKLAAEKRKRLEGSSGLLPLKQLLSKLNHEPFDSESGIDLEESGMGRGDLTGLSTRRLVFRRLAQSEPGMLTLRALKEYRQLLGAADEPIGAEDEWGLVFLRYLLQVFLVHYPGGQLSEPVFRELRTYCEALDGLLRGNTLQVLDLLTMQLRSTIMAINDGHWNAARYLQLLPESQLSTVATAEDEALARKMEAQDLKLEALKKQGGTRPG